ncbi:MAG: hypothetical protein KatS3mg013_1237 [Actinomycetota bacterium]|nr:MAG: hypothetical protein KatS3mg013_1237 [Actinomycetota bacterium]
MVAEGGDQALPLEDRRMEVEQEPPEGPRGAIEEADDLLGGRARAGVGEQAPEAAEAQRGGREPLDRTVVEVEGDPLPLPLLGPDHGREEAAALLFRPPGPLEGLVLLGHVQHHPVDHPVGAEDGAVAEPDGPPVAGEHPVLDRARPAHRHRPGLDRCPPGPGPVPVLGVEVA